MDNTTQFHPVVEQIEKIIKKNSCWHETFIHEPVITSEEASKMRTGYTIEQGAKALIVKIEKRNKESAFCMLVLPAHLKLDSKKVKGLLEIKNLRFASEEEIGVLTGGIQRGAIPPFGNLFGMQIYVDPLLFKNEKMVFNAGDRRYSIAIMTKDYKRIVNPVPLDMHDSGRA